MLPVAIRRSATPSPQQGSRRLVVTPSGNSIPLVISFTCSGSPPYLSVIEEGGHTGRDEKRFLVNSLCHLMIGGLLLLRPALVQLYAVGIAVVTSCHQAKCNTVLRKSRGDGSQEVSGLLRQVQDADKIPELTELPEKSYPLIITNLLPLLFSFFSNCSNFFVTSCITPISVSNCSWGQSMFER